MQQESVVYQPAGWRGMLRSPEGMPLWDLPVMSGVYLQVPVGLGGFADKPAARDLIYRTLLYDVYNNNILLLMFNSNTPSAPPSILCV